MSRSTKQNNSVFDDLGFDAAEAANLRLRSELMIAIEQWIIASGLTQKQAGERLGVSQARVSDLMRGKIQLFSVDMLVSLAARLGLEIRLVIDHAA